MTEEPRKVVERLRKGHAIECSADAYRSEIRDALIRFALDCVKNNDTARIRVALAEVNRLDEQHEVLSKLEKFVNFRGKSPISIAQNRELGGKYSDERSEKEPISVRPDRYAMGIHQTAVTARC